MPQLNWRWYSRYRFGNANTPLNDIDDAEIDACIRLFRDTANVHLNDNFKGQDTNPIIKGYRNRLKDSAAHGYVVMALGEDNQGNLKNSLFFQYSRAMSQPRAISVGEPDPPPAPPWNSALEPPAPVWVVSLALQKSDFANDDPKDKGLTRAFIRSQLTPALKKFMNVMKVDAIYSVETTDVDDPEDAIQSAIGRVHVNGDGDEWKTDGAARTFTGSSPHIKHWAGDYGANGNSYEYRLTKIIEV